MIPIFFGQSQVNQIQTDYQNKTVGELANLAVSGDARAKTAIKILKQEKKAKNMVENKFPLGCNLSAVSIVEDEQFGGDDVCLQQV